MADETMSDLTCRGEISDDDISFTGCLWIQRQERQVEEEERGIKEIKEKRELKWSIKDSSASFNRLYDEDALPEHVRESRPTYLP